MSPNHGEGHQQQEAVRTTSRAGGTPSNGSLVDSGMAIERSSPTSPSPALSSSSRQARGLLPALVEDEPAGKEQVASRTPAAVRKRLSTLQLSKFYSVLVERGVRSAPTLGASEEIPLPVDIAVTQCVSAPLSPEPAASPEDAVTSQVVTSQVVTSHVLAGKPKPRGGAFLAQVAAVDSTRRAIITNVLPSKVSKLTVTTKITPTGGTRGQYAGRRTATFKIKAVCARPIQKDSGKKGDDVLTGGRYHRVKRDKNIPEDLQYRPKVSLPSNKEPTFFIGGCNGVQIVSDALEALGWRRSKDKLDENYKLKWTELKSHINYAAFKEGEQLVNHIPNCQLLTNKVGLLSSLQEYERLTTSMNPKAKRPKLRLNDFLPETYRLDDPKEREQFFQTFKENDVWICKPTGKNQGRGIYLVRSADEIRKTVEDHENDKQQPKSAKPQNRIIQRRKWQHYYDNIVDRVIQRYIMNPLLLNKRKFDIRCYMLLASTTPYLVLYHQGYIRLSMVEYDNDSNNLIAHLTNQFIQKRDPMYKENKEETAWSMDRFNDYINKHVAPVKNLESDWAYNTLTNKMKQITLYAFHSAKARLQTKIGYFELYGLDFMVDEDMKVYLIEVNVNPCLAINCEALKEVVPGVAREAIYLSIECFEKNRKGRPLMPLQSLRNFDVLYNGSPKVKPTAPATTLRTVSTSPSRASRGSSPADGKTPTSTPHQDGSVKSSSSTTPIIRRSKSLSPAKEYVTPASGGVVSGGSGSGSAGLISIQTLDADGGVSSEPLQRRGRGGAGHHHQRPSPAFPQPSPPQRGLAPKATSTILGPGFRKSTFPSLVDASSSSAPGALPSSATSPTGAPPSPGHFSGPKAHVQSPLASSGDAVRFRMTHGAHQKRARSRTRERGEKGETGLGALGGGEGMQKVQLITTTTKLSRGS